MNELCKTNSKNFCYIKCKCLNCNPFFNFEKFEKRNKIQKRKKDCVRYKKE